MKEIFLRIIPDIENYTVSNESIEADNQNLLLVNGDSISTSSLGRNSKSFKDRNSDFKRDRSLNRSFFKKREKSPKLPHQNLAPDPRLQITNLQDKTSQGDTNFKFLPKS